MEGHREGSRFSSRCSVGGSTAYDLSRRKGGVQWLNFSMKKKTQKLVNAVSMTANVENIPKGAITLDEFSDRQSAK